MTLPLLVLCAACGGESTHRSSARATGGKDSDSACADPSAVVPSVPPFEIPPSGQQPAYLVTFRNRCSRTVWPAWQSGGGLDYTVIDTELWLPLAAASEHTVTFYSVVRDIAFWGRTGCDFDRQGSGACETGDCGGFVCPTGGFNLPENATVYTLFGGFRGGYNLSLRVEGPACGEHECALDPGECSTVIANACGEPIACTNLCEGSSAPCCDRRGSECSMGGPLAPGAASAGDLVITFCPDS
jgi:hypothetical protein